MRDSLTLPPKGVTGWAVGLSYDKPPPERRDAEEAQALYDKLEKAILPVYYDDPVRWTTVMRYTIALNASFFNTHRMMHEYIVHAYCDR